MNTENPLSADCPNIVTWQPHEYETEEGEPLLVLAFQTKVGEVVVLELDKEDFHQFLKILMRCSEIFEPDNE